MSAQVLLDRGELLRLNRTRNVGLRIRAGSAWVTQPGDATDHDLEGGEALELNGRAPMLLTAYEPTLVELYRNDAVSLRLRVEADAAASRLTQMHAAFRRLARLVSAFALRNPLRRPG